MEGLRKGWEEKISKCNILLQGELSIIHPISYRIYRNWEDLEDYQLDGIMKTKEVYYKMKFEFDQNYKKISEIIGMRKRGELVVDYSYQRRAVWGEKDWIRLVETILLKFGCPISIFLEF